MASAASLSRLSFQARQYASTTARLACSGVGLLEPISDKPRHSRKSLEVPTQIWWESMIGPRVDVLAPDPAVVVEVDHHHPAAVHRISVGVLHYAVCLSPMRHLRIIEGSDGFVHPALLHCDQGLGVEGSYRFTTLQPVVRHE